MSEYQPTEDVPTDEAATRQGFSRRDFIKTGVGVAGLAATASILAACDSGSDGTTTTAGGVTALAIR